MSPMKTSGSQTPFLIASCIWVAFLVTVYFSTGSPAATLIPTSINCKDGGSLPLSCWITDEQGLLKSPRSIGKEVVDLNYPGDSHSLIDSTVASYLYNNSYCVALVQSDARTGERTEEYQVVLTGISHPLCNSFDSD